MFSHRSNNFYYTTLHLQIGDLSQEVGELREELQRIQVDQQTGSGQSQSTASAAPDVDVHDLSRDAAERLLVDCLTSKQFSRALHLMKNLRYVSRGADTGSPDRFACTKQDEYRKVDFIFGNRHRRYS